MKNYHKIITSKFLIILKLLTIPTSVFADINNKSEFLIKNFYNKLCFENNYYNHIFK